MKPTRNRRNKTASLPVDGNPDDVFALADPSSLEIPTSLSPGLVSRGSAPAGMVDDQSKLDPSALVEEVWSRAGEWGGTLILVGAWLTVVLFVLFLLLGARNSTAWPSSLFWSAGWWRP